MRQQISNVGPGVANGTAVPVDRDGWPNISVQVIVTGTVTYTVQMTLDDPFDLTLTPNWFSVPDVNLVAQTASKLGSLSMIPAALRAITTAGTGSVRMTVLQTGLLA